MKGFTLIEIMIAVIVLMVAAMGFASLTVTHARSNDAAADMVAAENMAQAKASDWVNNPWFDLGSVEDREDTDAEKYGVTRARMFQEKKLNVLGHSKDEQYAIENEHAESPCYGTNSGTYQNAPQDCQKWIDDFGAYKFTRTWVVCAGNDPTIYQTGTQYTDPRAEYGSRWKQEPDCLIDADADSSRTVALACLHTDFSTDMGPENLEKKIKVLVTWRDQGGMCHSTHLETTVIKN